MVDIKDVNLAAEAVNLGQRYDMHSTAKYKKINDQVLELQSRLKDTLLCLKVELSAIKAKNPDANEFDLSKHWELILDFQELFNEMRQELKKEKIEMFGKDEFEKSKKVSKADLEKLIEQLENAADDNKHKIQHQTNELFTQANLALTIYDALSKLLRSILQSQERRAQQLGKTY